MSVGILNVDCCGCSACSIVCPTGAITMKFNDNGAYMSCIDDHKCVSCKACEKICTVLNSNNNESTVPISKERVYIAAALDKKILEKSSSGGVGYVFAEKATGMGYDVCGVTYDVENKCAAHVVIKDKNELYKIQGSKYLQSANSAAFKEILDSEKGIIFGTPCQIEGIEKILRSRKKRENFILVDIFCHGVPLQLLWDRHLEWLDKTKRVDISSEASFRKRKKFILTIGDYSAFYNEDAFFTFFLRGYLKNKRCYNCHLRRKSAADIRIGDCMTKKYNKLNFSPSCIIVNTPTGQYFLDYCADRLELYPESYDEIDSIQEKENMDIPENYEDIIMQLKNGRYPEQIIKNTVVSGRIKSLIKNRLFRGKDTGISDIKDIVQRM